MTAHLLAAFVAASVVLAVTPGPGVVYIVARTAAQGRAAGLASVAGVALGNFCNAVAASIGLAALLAASSLAFTAVQWAGAAYLAYLGVRALRTPPSAAQAPAFRSPALGRIFRDGFAVALLNPKTALFFAALLPPFMDPAQPAAVQGLTLAAVFVAIAMLTDSIYVLAVGLARARLVGQPRTERLGRYATAATFFGLGLFAAATGSRSTT